MSGRNDIDAGAEFLGCAELPLMQTLPSITMNTLANHLQRSLTLEDMVPLQLQRREGNQVGGGVYSCVGGCVCFDIDAGVRVWVWVRMLAQVFW